MHYFKAIKQKKLTDNMDQLSNLNIGLDSDCYLIYNYSCFIDLIKPDFNPYNKGATGTESFVSVISIFFLDLQQY